MATVKEFYLDPRDGTANFEYDDNTTKQVKLDQSSVSGGGAIRRGTGVTTVWSAARNGLAGVTPTACTVSIESLNGETVMKLAGTAVNTNMQVDIDLSATPFSYFGGVHIECYTDTSKTTNIVTLASADSGFLAYAQGGFAPTAWNETNGLVSSTVQKFISQWHPGGAIADTQFSPGYQGAWASTPPTYPVDMKKVRVRFNAKTGFAPVAYLKMVGVTGGRKSRVSVSIDDGLISAYQYMRPVFEKHNLTCSWAIIADKIGGAGFMTVDNLRELYKNGHEMITHGPKITGRVGDVVNNYLSDPDPVASAVADACYHRDALRSWGVLSSAAEKVYVWPRGAHARSVDDLAYDEGMKAAGFTLGRSYSITPYSFVAEQWPNQMMLPVIGHAQASGSLANEQANIQLIINRINDAALRGTDVILVLHEGAGPTYDTWSTALYIRSDHLNQICAAIRANVNAGTQECVLLSALAA